MPSVATISTTPLSTKYISWPNSPAFMIQSPADKYIRLSQTQIDGCAFAQSAKDKKNNNIQISLLNNTINTNNNEFAPIPFSDNSLYFSSYSAGTSKVYRTEKLTASTWKSPRMPSIFKENIDKSNFGNGSFNPDGKRFYFTQCLQPLNDNSAWEIYVMYEERGNWSKPVKLPETINLKGYNNTQPYVAVGEKEEVLFFVSNRPGGLGGLDIWFTVRNLETNEFSNPENLGENINTAEDEQSPFYHIFSKTLYFSSQGRLNAGGFDIFKSEGNKNEWAKAENIGFPINSSADDLFFTISEEQGGGYFISDRIFGNEKKTEGNDDIFYYEELINIAVMGRFLNEKDSSQINLSNGLIKIFDSSEKSEFTFEKILSDTSAYKLELLSGKEFILELNADGYEPFSTKVSTKEYKKQKTLLLDIRLRKITPKKEDKGIYIIVPETYDSKLNPYTLPGSINIDPETGKPYPEGSRGYISYMEANAIAEKADGRKLYWENNKLVPYKELEEADDPKTSKNRLYLIVPKEYNSSNNTFIVPTEIPIDPKTGKAFAEDTEEYLAFVEISKIAEGSKDRKVYWENDRLVPYNKTDDEINEDLKFAIVPEKFNSPENAMVLPKSVPIDPKTGKPYPFGSAGYKTFLYADSIAQSSKDRKVYWDKGSLKAVENVESKYLAVDKKYNSQNNTYEVPNSIPIDPKTNKPYEKGTDGYKAFIEAQNIAKKSPEGKVYWENNVLKPHIPEDANVETESKDLTYKVQVAAMKNLNYIKYKELSKEKFPDCEIVYEKIENGITRIIVVPSQKNEDGIQGFRSKEEALNVLKNVIDNTAFKSAFISTYQGNKRLFGIIRLTNNEKK